MPLTAFDHVNIRTSKLDAMIEWYGAVLGLVPGPRPDFGFPGAWLYLGEEALVHLVGVEAITPPEDTPSLEHAAFRASGMRDFLATLDARGEPYRIGEVTDIGVLQVNIHDPEGNHIHVDFDASERP